MSSFLKHLDTISYTACLSDLVPKKHKFSAQSTLKTLKIVILNSIPLHATTESLKVCKNLFVIQRNIKVKKNQTFAKKTEKIECNDLYLFRKSFFLLEKICIFNFS